jgi:capsular exopolysaccharide synthesis family protein
VSQVGSSGIQQASTLRDYLQIARRGWGLILIAVVIAPLSAALFSMRQDKLYEASAEVLVRSFDASDPDRALQTQADVATASSTVARSVRTALGLSTIPEIEVTPKTDSDILIFSSTATSPQLAARVATEYASQFRDFQRDLVTADIVRALDEVEAEIEELQSVPPRRRDQALYESLLDKREDLRTTEALETSRALVVRPADPGNQVQPKLIRNTALGLVLGIVFGLVLAFLREALDTRVRSTDEVAERLGVPLLARVPEPPRRLRHENRLAMINDPDGPDAAAFRILRANVDFARMDTDARTLLVTSAVAGEGKSTTAANLAVALARAGQRVALVDLDLRRPVIHKFFDLDGPGVAQVAIGRASLEEALAPIPLVWAAGSAWNGNRSGILLEVLPVGPMPPHVDDVLANRVVAGVLENLRDRADIVLVDSTPLLEGEAMTVTAAVDAVVVVIRMDIVRRPMLRELRRVLDAVPARKIGFVATGMGSGDSYPAYPGYLASTPRMREPVA